MTTYDTGSTLASISTTSVGASNFNDKVFDTTNHTTWSQYNTTFGTLDILNGNLDYTLLGTTKVTPEKIKYGAFSRGRQVAQNLNIDIFKDMAIWDKYFMIPGACITVDAPYDNGTNALVTYNIMLSNAGSFISNDTTDSAQQPNVVLFQNDTIVKYCGRLQPGIDRKTTLAPRWKAYRGRHYLCGHAYLRLDKGMNNIGLGLRGNSEQVRVHARAIRVVLLKPE